jgi:hypothetical protein
MPDRPARPDRRVPIALLLTALAFALYALTANQHWNVDGIGLFQVHCTGAETQYRHVLYLLTAKLVAAVLPGASGELQMRAVSAVPGALCVGASFLLARALGARRSSAVFAALALAVSPALWLAATWIEVHALHAGVVALVVLGVLAAAKRGLGAALAVASVGLLLVFGTHQSGTILAPGLVLWVAAAMRRAGRRISVRTTLFVVGPVLLAVLVLGMCATQYYRVGEFSLATEEKAAFFDKWGAVASVPRVLIGEWLLPAGLLLPLGLVGVCVRRDFARASLLGFVLPSFAFFVWFGIDEHGGYALASLTLLAVLAAFALEPLPARARIVAGVALVLVQGAYGAWSVADWGRTNRIDERIAQVRLALPEGGTLFAIRRFRNDAPLMQFFADDVEELRLQVLLLVSWRQGYSDAQIAAAVVEQLDQALANGPVAIDLSFTFPAMREAEQAALDYQAAIVAGIYATYETRDLPHASWPMVVLDGRR